jgi:hypothetical protein
MFSSVANGLRAAAKQPRLVACLWAAYFVFSLVPVLPGLAWLRAGLDVSPASADALERFDFGLLSDLLNYDRSNVFSLLFLSMVAAGMVALVASAFVMGGILEVLGGGGGGDDSDRRTFMHRFARGGGHFFWRFVRLAVTAGVCGVLATGIVAALIGAVTAPLGESEWEPGGYLAGLLVVLSVAGTAALFLLALDYARIRVARDDGRKMLRAYFSGLGFVVRHLVGAYGIALGTIATLAGVMLLYIAYETNSPVSSTGALIALLFVLQQITVAARVFLRVALIGAERAYFARMSPVVAAPLPTVVTPATEQPAAAPDLLATDLPATDL